MAKTTLNPTPFRMPRVPSPGRQRRVFERKGLELRPLTGPEIPLPPDEDADLKARWDIWRQQTSGSLPEFIVWEWLIKVKRQVEGVDFIYQWGIFGGRTQFGGFVIDFWFPSKKTGWRVQGLRYHHTHPDDRGRDLIAAQLLSSRGIAVVDLHEDDLMTRPEYTLNKAWIGESLKRP